MKHYVRSVVAAAAMFATLGIVAADESAGRKGETPDVSAKSIYDFTMKDINGADVSLRKFEGYLMLVVNVASR